jgi:hypothetical protein
MRRDYPSSSEQPTSTILESFFKGYPQDEIVFGDIIHYLNERAFGVILLFLALPNALLLATIPGVSTLFGLPICFVAIQMIFGIKHPWLPGKIRHATMSRAECLKIIKVAKPYLAKMECFTKPRLKFLSHSIAERFFGFISLLLGVLIALPIPMGNFLGGLCLMILAIGLIERDGYLLILGTLLSGAILSGLGKLIMLIIQQLIFFLT